MPPTNRQRDLWSPLPDPVAASRATSPFFLMTTGAMDPEEVLRAQGPTFSSLWDAEPAGSSTSIRSGTPFTLASEGLMSPGDALNAEFWSNAPVPGRDVLTVSEEDFDQADSDSMDDSSICPELIFYQAKPALKGGAPKAELALVENMSAESDDDHESEAESDGEGTTKTGINFTDSMIICPLRDAHPQSGCGELMYSDYFLEHFHQQHFYRFLQHSAKRDAYEWKCPLDARPDDSSSPPHKCPRLLKASGYNPNLAQGLGSDISRNHLISILRHIYRRCGKSKPRSHSIEPQGYRARMKDGTIVRDGERCWVYMK
ncbi:hypothetical protein MD484_g3493, partial [Candolleomyces efflorescens]